jgi:phosphoribosylformylglycinamidine synthase
MAIRIDVRGPHQARVREILTAAPHFGILGIRACRIARVFFLSEDLALAEIERLCAALLVDPVTETYTWAMLPGDPPPNDEYAFAVEVAFRPGVTDVTARELVKGMAELGLPPCDVVTARRYELNGDMTEADVRLLTRRLLCNDTVEHFGLGAIAPQFGMVSAASDRVETIALRELDDDALLALSRDRLLSLDLAEMHCIRDYYRSAGRDPSDVELETLAQTWSEHCVHKTFRARIDFTWRDQTGAVKQNAEINGLLRQYIRAATEEIAPPWLRSAFVDNAGIIAFDDANDLAFKVETHNHPSALEPFGGANTGVGGVVRDIIGVSARPIAATDVLCFGPQDYAYEQLPEGLLHPRRIAAGVVAGVGDYGNKLGLPTVNGAVLYDEGYLGNPLVFCGCAGLLPIGSHRTEPQIDDLVVVLGGRTGRDGLHGATFSSAELTHQTAEVAGSAVQIGDPITEKGLIELIEAARDAGLYHAITDCGAGGLSSAVGEMGRELGVDVELQHVLLKYPGLVPWEIWLSEAQERMVIAVPPDALAKLSEFARLWEVELSVLGRFTGDGRLRVRYADLVVAELPMSFLHDGLPQRRLRAEYCDPPSTVSATPDRPDVAALLLRMLAHPNVASKETIVRRYDHEVRGGSIVRPFTGPQHDGPSDAAALKPLGTWGHDRGFVLSAGINPAIGRIDPYAMAVSAIDEAVRNAVAVGADPDRLAILDNFCWGNPTLPDRLGALVRACQGCYDGALAYRTPFISGKDSLFNEYNGRPIPGTLLISAIGIVPDIHRCVTADFKAAGNRIYLLGETKRELGGSLLHELLQIAGGDAPSTPDNPLSRYRLLHQAIRHGLVRACHDLSEGGLGVALAEMCIGGRLGASIAIPAVGGMTPAGTLFAESNGRLVIEVAPADASALEALFAGETLIPLGEVTRDGRLRAWAGQEPMLDLPLEDLVAAWQRDLLA